MMKKGRDQYIRVETTASAVRETPMETMDTARPYDGRGAPSPQDRTLT